MDECPPQAFHVHITDSRTRSFQPLPVLIFLSDPSILEGRSRASFNRTTYLDHGFSLLNHTIAVDMAELPARLHPFSKRQK